MWPPPPIKPKLFTAIAILPLLLFYTKQTSAQEPANGMLQTYGLGGYKMDDDKKTVMVPDDALLLKTDDDVMKYKTNKHTDTQFKPCRVELNKGEEGNEFEVFYDKDTANGGCTVDFVMDEIDEITTHIKVTDTEMACLEDCGKNEMAASSKNLVPFTYSMSNEDIKNLHSGPPYKEDKTCDEACAESGGKCMASATSLQVAWTKCTKQRVKARAWILLVGEPVSSWSAKVQQNKRKENPDVATFELSIEMGDNPHYPGNNVPLFTIAGQSFLYKEDSGKFIYPDCFLDDALPMIPVPKFWTINSDNAQLNGKHLLVFHFLPQAATRIFDKEGMLQNDQPPEPGMPNCVGKLSIAFENVAGLLQSSGFPHSTPTEAVATAPKITAPEIHTGNEKAVPTTGETATSTGTPNANEAMTTAPGIYTWILFANIVGSVVALLIIVGVLVWYLCCMDKEEVIKDSEEDAEADADMDMDIAKEEEAEE